MFAGMVINGVHFPEDRIAEFCRRHGVARLSLFGSILREPSPEGGYGSGPAAMWTSSGVSTGRVRSLLDIGGC